jgi:SAM-dependent methyltransferase
MIYGVIFYIICHLNFLMNSFQSGLALLGAIVDDVSPSFDSVIDCVAMNSSFISISFHLENGFIVVVDVIVIVTFNLADETALSLLQMKRQACIRLISHVSIVSAFPSSLFISSQRRHATFLEEAAQPIEITVTTSQQAVFEALDFLYDSSLLEERNALSRTDGYWPYVESNRDPPREYTYGEFDLSFFAHLLTIYCRDCKSFRDIGSGTGQLVFAAAALMPSFEKCSGLEILPRLHECAISNLDRCRRNKEDIPILPSSDIELKPFIQFEQGSLEDPYMFIGDADVIFCFASCMPEPVRAALAIQIGRQCKHGTIVMTSEYPLHLSGTCPAVIDDEERIPEGIYELELVDTVTGPCDVVGGTSTVYIHRVNQSMQLPKIEPPVLSLEQIAYRAVQQAEKTRDTDAFLRKVYNNMVFLGLPESFWPRSFQR